MNMPVVQGGRSENKTHLKNGRVVGCVALHPPYIFIVIASEAKQSRLTAVPERVLSSTNRDPRNVR